jgi:hypothetical protein
MVLHLILRRAAVADTGSPANRACAWPDSINPRGWGDVFEFLFQDHDVLMLYDMPAQVAESAAGAVNLDPARWFTEFGLPYSVPDRPTWPTRSTTALAARPEVGWPAPRLLDEFVPMAQSPTARVPLSEWNALRWPWCARTDWILDHGPNMCVGPCARTGSAVQACGCVNSLSAGV